MLSLALLLAALPSPLPVSLGASPGSIAPSDLHNEIHVAAHVDEERLARRVREICAFGPRMGGTPAGNAITEWRAERFRAMQLDVQVIEGKEQWVHWEPSWRVVVHARPAAGGESEELPLTSAWPWGFSPAASGRVALASDPTGGAAWLTGRASRRHKDLALALVDGSATLDGRYAVVHHLAQGAENPFPVFGLSTPEGALLRERLEQGQTLEVEFELEAHIERARPRTVVASLAAREGAPPGALLFCAHGDSDSGGPGANDNGSGEAIVMEIADVWARCVRWGLVEAPAREVRFALWGTEIASTRHYLASLAPGELIGVVNYDQSGFGSGADQLSIEPDDLPANVAFIRTLLAVLEEHATTPAAQAFPQQWATNKSLGGTDSYVFSGSDGFKQGGLPALTLFASAWGQPDEQPRTAGMPGESWSERELVRVDHDVHYHSAGDTPENTTDLEPFNMAWSARVGLLAGMRWLAGLEAR